MSRIAIYPGSFDPPTLAHQEILEQAKQVFDRVYVVIAKHGEKSGKFNSKQRLDMWRAIGHQDTIVVDPTTCVRDWTEMLGASHVVRGIRAGEDVQPEQAYKKFVRASSRADVVYFMPPPRFQHVSSTAVRQILALKDPMLLSGWMDARIVGYALSGTWIR